MATKSGSPTFVLPEAGLAPNKAFFEEGKTECVYQSTLFDNCEKSVLSTCAQLFLPDNFICLHQRKINNSVRSKINPVEYSIKSYEEFGLVKLM